MKTTNSFVAVRAAMLVGGMAVLMALLLSGCEKAFMQPAPGTDPKSIFNEAWTFVDREYSYFDFKKVDWDSVKTVYEAKVTDNMSDEALFGVIAEMLYQLRDGHVNLTSDFDRSRNWTWFLDYPSNYDSKLIERSYFQEKEQYVGSFVVYDFGDVGYMQYGSFGSPVSDDDMQYILKKFQNHKGLIIDVRDNGGGSIGNVSMIAKYFTNAKVTVGKQRYRNGPKHSDFSEDQDFILVPGSLYYDKPVVVLTNRLCYSATTFFSQTMRELPTVTLLGDTTGGGGGAPSASELANGWMLRATNTRLLTPSGQDVEGGVPPDTVVSMVKTDADAGFDTLIEEALKRIRR